MSDSEKRARRRWVFPAVGAAVVAGLAIGAVAVMSRGEDDGPDTGRAEIVIGGGDDRLPVGNTLTAPEPAGEAAGHLIPVVDPLEMDSEAVAGVRGIGVGEDGRVVFQYGTQIYDIVDGELRRIPGSSYEQVDVVVLEDGTIVGAPKVMAADRGPALLEFGPEMVEIAPGATESSPGGGRLAVTDAGTVLRTIRTALLRVDPTTGRVETLARNEGCRRQPLGVAPAGDGAAWVGGRLCGVIERLEPDGTISATIGARQDGACTGDRDFAITTGIIAFGLALDGDGRLWVADPFCGGIEVLERDTLEPVPVSITGARRPVDIDFDGDGNLYVLDAELKAVLRVPAGDLP